MVAVISVDACPFWFSDMTSHLEGTGVGVF